MGCAESLNFKCCHSNTPLSKDTSSSSGQLNARALAIQELDILSTSSASSLPNIQIVDINEFFAIQDVITFGALRYSNTIDPAVPSATPLLSTSTLTPSINVSLVNLDEDLQRILGQGLIFTK
jgi:hypothetical protein